MVLDEKTREAIALFRYGLIAEYVHRPRGEQGLSVSLQKKATLEYEIPGSRRTHVAAETMRDWLNEYRQGGGFKALMPQVRGDRGQTRAIPQDVADLLCSLKEETPGLSVAAVIEQARQKGGIPKEQILAHATVHRLLASRDLMGRKKDEPTSKDRLRFAYERANELWMSDVMHAPAVFSEGRKRKTYLISLLDDATRVIPYAAFAFSENTAAFLSVFQQAIRRRGCPRRLYVDNGAAYRSRQLSLICAKLGMALIHARPYQPQGKGKQERFFRTVRMQFLPLLGEADFRSLDAINRRLWAWVEGEYHMRPHRGLDGITPLDKWTMTAQDVHLIDQGSDFSELFLFEEKRKVQKDRTVSLNGAVYEVEASLVGETVILRFDPSRPARPLDVYFKGHRMQQAKPVDAYANCFVRRDHTTKALQADRPQDPPAGLRLRDLLKREED